MMQLGKSVLRCFVDSAVGFRLAIHQPNTMLVEFMVVYLVVACLRGGGCWWWGGLGLLGLVGVVVSLLGIGGGVGYSMGLHLLGWGCGFSCTTVFRWSVFPL
ncbi:hypothetical protein U1Q18_010849 [Sarracenia purpurea var. burkii]